MESFLITGATGYIGSMLVKHIKEHIKGAEVTVLVRDRLKAETMLPEGVDILTADLTDRAAMEELKPACTGILHCAAVTKSAEMVAHPVEVAEGIINGTQNVLELAKRCNIKSMVYLSSMEVYGSIDCVEGQRVTEEEAGRGEVGILSARSCYPLGKRMAENLCYSYYKEYAVPVKIARLAQTFGRGILADDTRIFAQFAQAVREGKDIVLHTKGHSMGNYCGIGDAIEGILAILERGVNGEAYNVVNEQNTMTIRQMADFVAEKVAGGKIQVVCDMLMNESRNNSMDHSNPYGYAPDTGLRLSGKKLMALGWEPREGLEDMFWEIV